MTTKALRSSGLTNTTDLLLASNNFVLVSKENLFKINQILRRLSALGEPEKLSPASQTWFQLLSHEKELIAYTSLLIDLALKESFGPISSELTENTDLTPKSTNQS